ncbi:flavodoxin family protein [Aeromicrobium chenweiae]|uniref:flavodoxin family protein n=1 Tax=Aeromicrobium chenweiae TaxID=2079793 RepID=UPI001F3B9191|nr:NAD(P)H-dependent oxidoreductase [Aeromicrobium chenweiae]
MARLLIVHHSPTPHLRRLTDAVVAGANDDAVQDVEVVVRPALETPVEDVLAADGYVLGTSANFGYMSGALKHFFDSTSASVELGESRKRSPFFHRSQHVPATLSFGLVWSREEPRLDGAAYEWQIST